MNAAPEQLDLLAEPDEHDPVTYRELVTIGTRSTGLEAARRGDPDAFNGAVQAIREAAAALGEFTSDDLNWSVRGPEVGAAFSALRKVGEITATEFAISERPNRHGGVVRRWRRT